jgi:uncharacterized membrane protein
MLGLNHPEFNVDYPKIGDNKMINFESTKTMAGEGALLLLLSIIPYVGWILGIVGIVLLLKSTRELSEYYGDEQIYRNSLRGVTYYIVALVAATVAVTALVIGIATATNFTFTATSGFVFSAGFGVGVAALFTGLVVAFVFYVLAASHLKITFNTLAEKSGEASFSTAGSLLWIGSILTIIGVGLILIFISWIFATIGFFTMKPRQFPQYAQTQPYGYTPPQQPASPTTPIQPTQPA